MKRIKLISRIGGKTLPHLGGTGKIPGGILHLSNTATMDPALIDRGNLIDGDWTKYSWMILKTNLMQNYSEISVTVNISLLSPTHGVKRIPPDTEN